MTRRMSIQLALLAALLVLTAVWSYGGMARGRRRALAAAADTADCARMAARIRRAAVRPVKASEFERLATETTGIIERSARSAQIPADRLVRISPEPPQRLGESVYKEKPTAVLLKSVSMKQLVVMMHTLVAAEFGLNVKSLRLSAPRPDETRDLWNAEMVVTYLIYAPPRERN